MEPTNGFLVALLQIILINIVLSGDNAVVIALACRSLPRRQQRMGIFLGAGAAVVLRLIFTAFVLYLMEVPYLKIVGGLLLFWIGYKLMLPEDGHDGEGVGFISLSVDLYRFFTYTKVAQPKISACFN